jgi:hypothetical protein
VNRFTLERLTDCFCAGQPRIVVVGQQTAWSVPVIFAYPAQVFGEAGIVLVDAETGEILGFTPPTEIIRNAQQFLS